MLSFAARRLAQAVAVLLAISAVTVALFYAAPSDPARSACGPKCEQDQLDSIRHSMGLDRPITTQYVEYLRGIVAGREVTDVDGSVRPCPAPCLGYSYFLHQDVRGAIADRFPVTLSLTIGAMVVVVLFGIGIGFVSAVRHGSTVDRALSTFTLLGASVQLYFVGYVAQYYLVFKSHLFPQPRYRQITDDPLGWFAGMLLPWLLLGFVSAAVYARLARTQMLETMGEEFVRTARAKGLGRWRTHLKYSSRGALAPLVQVMGLEVGFLLGGTVIAETVFGLNGIGKLSVDAIRQNDLPTVMGTVLLAAFFVVVLIAVADFVIAALDPRVRLR